MLDLDYYKLTMLQFIWKHYAGLPVRWRMHSRKQALETILAHVNLDYVVDSYLQAASRGLSYEQVLWLTKQGFDPAFVNDLDRLFRGGLARPIFTDRDVTVEGTWFNTTLWETVLLSAVSERYSRDNYQRPVVNEPLFEQFDNLGIRWADFGTRRRFSKESHAELVYAASQHESFLGTSNVELAMRFGVKPIGTYAHELEMVLRNWHRNEFETSRTVMRKWFDMYPAEQRVVLTDTYGTKEFLRQHDNYFLNNTSRASGLRIDSGDPFEVGGLINDMLKSWKTTRNGVFSDGLDVMTIILLHNRFKDTSLHPLFGWGTGFTNPHSQLSLVMKAVESNGPTYKRTDSADKSIG